MANAPDDARDEKEAVTTYSMHVSAKYLELTKKKLDLTRLPREVELPEQRIWEQGTPKTVLEPLLDFWLDGYDWRAAEAHFNLTLPQYRTSITTNAIPPECLRMHFVHKRSTQKNAIPLLFCHTWPSSFIEVQRVIDALTDPHSLPGFGDGAQQAFHVVAPSTPGFGFSDASMADDFGLHGTADVFDRLMNRLGYDRYVTHGAGWGSSICRALALRHPDHCVAVHTANPVFTKPTFKRNPSAYMKYWIAKLTKATIPLLSFGYVPADMQAQPKSKSDENSPESLYTHRPLSPTLHRFYSLRPQTLAFSLCDSPVGLLAGLLDVIHTRAPATSVLTSRSRSPFLSPVELEMQDASYEEHGQVHSMSAEHAQNPNSPQPGGGDVPNYTWSPTEVLNFTMLQWLPGPEAGLRWLRRAHLETTGPQWNKYCPVPLGISSFHSRNSSRATPLMWGTSSWDVAWVKRHQRNASFPAIEAPDLLVLDLRECFATFLSQGKLPNLPIATS